MGLSIFRPPYSISTSPDLKARFRRTTAVGHFGEFHSAVYPLKVRLNATIGRKLAGMT